MKTKLQWLADELKKAEHSNMARGAYFEARAYQLYQMLEIERESSLKRSINAEAARSIRG